MQNILEAVLTDGIRAEDLANLPLPASYRGLTIHQDEIGMFDGMATRDKDPRASFTWTRYRCRNRTRVRPSSRSWPVR